MSEVRNRRSEVGGRSQISDSLFLTSEIRLLTSVFSSSQVAAGINDPVNRPDDKLIVDLC